MLRQSQGYLRWIVENFRSCKEWPWVDSARTLLDQDIANGSSIKQSQFSVPNIGLILDGPAFDREGAQFGVSSNGSSIEPCWVDQELGFSEPNTGLYGSLLKRCVDRRDLAAGKRVHAHAVESGYARDSYVENFLIQMYGKCRRVDLARAVFDAMPRRDLFSWNIIITAYTQNGHSLKALELFQVMRDSGIKPDVFVLSSAMGAYARCGQIDRAREIFDAMETRDPASWTAIISAYAQQGDPALAMELYWRMNLEGMEPNRLTYVSLLGGCASLGALDHGKSIYSRFLARGFQADLMIQSALLNLHSKCGSLEDARAQFATITDRDAAAWTSMIEASARHGRYVEAVTLYREMTLDGVTPDAVAYVAVLGACAALGAAAVHVGRSVHAALHAAGLGHHTRVSTALLNMYGRCGSSCDARHAFERIHAKDVVAWNAMLRALARHERYAEAFDLFLAMDAPPDSITFGTLLTACCCGAALGHGRRIHERLNLHHAVGGIKLEVEMYNLLLNMYAKCGSIEEARAVFERMPARTLVGWNAMVVWYARYAIPREALHLFQEMASLDGLEPDVVSCIGALAACASLGYLTEGRAVHRACTARIMTGDDQRRDVVLWTSLVNMYAKCGEIEEASLVFEEMDERNAVSFNAMMAAFAQNGHLDRALGLYRRMICEEGLDADVVTLLCLLVACNHAGLYAQGRDLFVQLRGDHEWIAPAVDHYHCLVDLLSRAGRIDVAEEILVWMPFQPGAIGWKSLLNGCAVHGDPVRGARAAAIACRLDPVDSSQYVLLSNAYAWNDLEDVRKTLDLCESQEM
ncbi:pentatricopeptide repeat-containing protein At3g12770 [Selaginella moellendorffii]|uniref:pentatricopeptide repeat-containing protein At3g12770 n=1 Tax=Selaginella moellendorffii TaxID=88036 RepID=UPI000D1C57C2|nr:pentatricopeptide repeat-containing protein At3g12770 [Selaginella moellendorffii]|eukprot:XP_024531915.1 pentatricopeptide repeat-containing protein At3g12770 [Selaginella moellendorffii]